LLCAVEPDVGDAILLMSMIEPPKGRAHSAEEWTPLNTRLPRYYGPLRHPKAPEPSLTSFRLVIPDHVKGLPVLRALSLCACRRHYPGAATGGPALLIRPAVSAFPDRVVGSACASSVSRLTQRLLTLRPAHSRCHRISWPA